VTAGNIRLACRKIGNGPPLILVNGIASAMDTWNPQVLECLSANHRLVIFDARGTGFSGPSGGAGSISLYARDVLHLMDALGIACADILGFSMGASVAQELAIGFPDRVGRLVLVAGTCGGGEAAGTDPGVWDRLLDKRGSVEVVSRRMFSLIFPAPWLESHDPLRYCPDVSETTPAEEIARQAEAFCSWPGSYDRLDRIRLPVLVIAGSEDAVIPPENSVLLCKKIPGARLELFYGAGHGLMYQCPERFCDCVADFLDR